MKNLCVSLMIVFSLNCANAQNYSVWWGTSSYDTLAGATDFFPPDYEIFFGFEFPLFDVKYSSVTFDMSGYGSFLNSNQINLYMFAGEYDYFVDTFPIHRAWRYQIDSSGIQKILKVEWRNVGIADDMSSLNPTDHRINFQVWLYENGIIELHFGEIDLANTPFYTDSTGFIWADGDSYGPWIQIGNSDLTEVYGISGRNDSIVIVYEEDSTDIFYDIPPEGWYYRWLPNEVVNSPTEKLLNHISVYPNPASLDLNIQNGSEVNTEAKVEVYSTSGKLILSKGLVLGHNKMSVSSLPAGIYIVRIRKGAATIYTKKIVKL